MGPETIHALPDGVTPPRIPPHVETPCRNEEVSGRKTKDGEVVDLWFGDYGDGRVRRSAYREAAKLCWSQCAVQNPEAFAECARYQAQAQPKFGVYGGVIPPTTQ